ncbi:MAG: hypothetical protein DMF84_14540 [Acidobacteria bacterium]|nr:MAG: hypothetical protein DMF84_14540 [Acidobacteriota bacterium]
MLLPLVLILALPQAPAKKVDACALLSTAEIRAVLGETMTDPKPNTQPAGGLLLFQCVFGTSSRRSISVAVAGPATGGGASITPREFWRREFHSSTESNEGREAEGENRPRVIAGLGDEAYWTGNRIAGALYVLRRDTFVRISVGGIPNERERIEKSKALARAAIKRL